MSPPLDWSVRHVLGHYPAAVRDGRALPLGNRGGFSGARLWRLDGACGSYCLRQEQPPGPAAAANPRGEETR